jgi:Rrf2 family protein
MKISTQGRYGLRALVDLVENEDSEGAIPLREISERQKISERYLEQLFAKLRKAGIVKSVRGAHGGYMLNRPADKITVGDVVKTLEGNLAPVDCTITNKGEQCQFEGECVTHEVWEEIKIKIEDIIESITLQDLKERSLELKEKNRDNKGYMYHI